MHEGRCCSELGLPGWPAIAEELMVHRDIELARLTGARIHLLHLSTAGSVELVRAAKADGLPVTAEAAPHHFSLTDELLARLRPGVQGQPAAAHGRRHRRAQGRARRRHDRRHRHRPRAAPAGDKEQPLDQAPPGMLGLETALGVALAELDMPLADVVAALSWKPAAIAGVADRHGRPIDAGRAGQPRRVRPRRDVAGAPGARWPASSRNTPYVGVDAARPGPPHDLRRRRRSSSTGRRSDDDR